MLSENSISKSKIQTLGEIADLIDGQLIGNASNKITGIATLLEASEYDISFLLDKKYIEDSKETNAAAVITFEQQPFFKNQIIVKHPRLALAILTDHFKHAIQDKTPHIHQSAVVDQSVNLGDNISIGAFSVVGKDASIGDNCKIHPHVVIGEGCKIGNGCIIHPGVVVYDTIILGDNCIIHAGTVIGSDGFGYVEIDKVWKKIEHLGGVDVGSNVEIGANSAIDRGCLGKTEIGAGTKIDNLVHVSHNVKIGYGCALAGQVGFVGGAELGDNVQVGGQAGFSLVKVASGSVVAAKAGVTKDIQEGAFVSGFPARLHSEELKTQAVLRKIIKNYNQKGR